MFIWYWCTVETEFCGPKFSVSEECGPITEGQDVLVYPNESCFMLPRFTYEEVD